MHVLPKGEHRCEACGAKRIRRARSHTPWQKTVAWLTPLERYACGECSHRGWRIPSGERHVLDVGLAPRPVEKRDRRKARKARAEIVRSVLIAVVLGATAALVFVLGN